MIFTGDERRFSMTLKPRIVLVMLVAFIAGGWLPASAQLSGEVNTAGSVGGGKRFGRDPQMPASTEVNDVPGMIGLAAVAEQFEDQNKADHYFGNALAILNKTTHIEGQRLLFTLKKFDKLLEEDPSPTASALHLRLMQLIDLPPEVDRSELTIGPETDTVQHNEPTATLIRNAQVAFKNNDMTVANEELHKAFDFESHLRTGQKSEENDIFHMCLKADTAYKLGVVNYKQRNYEFALNYMSHVVETYDNAYGPNSGAALRAHRAYDEIQAAAHRSSQQAGQQVDDGSL
jgi:hypothetical protein